VRAKVVCQRSDTALRAEALRPLHSRLALVGEGKTAVHLSVAGAASHAQMDGSFALTVQSVSGKAADDSRIPPDHPVFP